MDTHWKMALRASTGMLTIIALAACGTVPSSPSAHPTSSTARITVTGTPTTTPAMSERQLALASAAARREIVLESAHVTKAFVSPAIGTVTDTNVGYACTSGGLLRIVLIGGFPHIVTSGIGADVVRALIMTTDGESGRVCQLSVSSRLRASPARAVTLSMP